MGLNPIPSGLADVVCKQLGLPLPGRTVGGSYWGAGTGPTWLDGVTCNGNEAVLGQVRISGFFFLKRLPPFPNNLQPPSCSANTVLGEILHQAVL